MHKRSLRPRLKLNLKRKLKLNQRLRRKRKKRKKPKLQLKCIIKRRKLMPNTIKATTRSTITIKNE